MSHQAAKRYAQALYEVCAGTKEFDRVHEDLQAIYHVAAENEQFIRFLKNPVIPQEKQIQIIEDGFQKKIHATTFKYLLFLIDKGRLSLLADIAELFDQLYLDSKNITKVKIFSSVSLNDSQVNSLKKHLKIKLDRDIETQLVVDPRMIGGVKVRIGDEIFDYTIQTQLEEFRQNFLQHRSK